MSGAQSREPVVVLEILGKLAEPQVESEPRANPSRGCCALERGGSSLYYTRKCPFTWARHSYQAVSGLWWNTGRRPDSLCYFRRTGRPGKFSELQLALEVMLSRPLPGRAARRWPAVIFSGILIFVRSRRDEVLAARKRKIKNSLHVWEGQLKHRALVPWCQHVHLCSWGFYLAGLW